MRRPALALVASGLLAAPGVATAEPPCAVAASATVVARSPSAVVYRRRAFTDPEYGLTTAYYGCLLGVGRRRLLHVDNSDDFLGGRARRFRTVGRWVAFARFHVDRNTSRFDYVHVADLRTGRSADVLVHDGDTSEPLGPLALTGSGRVGWILRETRTPETIPVGVWTLEHGVARALDTGPQRFGRLRFAGDRLTWTRDGAPRSARVAPAVAGP